MAVAGSFVQLSGSRAPALGVCVSGALAGLSECLHRVLQADVHVLVSVLPDQSKEENERSLGDVFQHQTARNKV